MGDPNASQAEAAAAGRRTDALVSAAGRKPAGRRPNPRRPVTMKDIAAAAGVAQSTVSRILNDAPVLITVSDETRERVQAIAEELGYRPHPFARTLRGAPSMLLGVVVRDITDPFFAQAIEVLSVEAKERGYSVVLGHARAKADEALALTAVLETRHCDAIVLVGDFRGEDRLVDDLRQAHVRVVGLWHGSERSGRPFPTVIVDARAGIHAALEHLMSLGHRRIAFVGHTSRYVIRDRHAAYQEYLAGAGVTVPAGYVCRVPNTIGSGHVAVSQLLGLAQPPTAILAATDFLAMDVLHAASMRGIVVPDQLSIVGFDDMPFASATIPSLTTVKMPINEMVAAGVALAVEDADWPSNGRGHPPRVVFQPRLVVRRSTARVPAEAALQRKGATTKATKKTQPHAAERAVDAAPKNT